MEYYYFYKQYESHFETSGAIEINCIMFAASFYVALLALNGLNTSINTRVPFSLYYLTLKPFFGKILEAFKLLLIVSRVSLREISSTS